VSDRYPRHGGDIPASPSFPAVEEQVLGYWESDGTFPASVARRPADSPDERVGGNEYVVYDGPPFANGLPHYGHLLTGYVKDVVPRYQTMRGRRVERRFGWDCHGLPAEVEAERQLGITHKSEIETMGVAEFNAACRASVLRYTREWERYVNRQARWVDFSNDYKTLDLPYMESVMWAFKSLHDKGLIYDGFRVLAYCWRCETPLSNTETRLDDTYRPRQDPASTVWFELETGERLLAWTTMPWTLVPNTNLVVRSDIDYAVLQLPDGHRYVLAESRTGAYRRELAGAEQVGTIRGADLVGRRYTPVFGVLRDTLADVPAAFTVLDGDFVSTEDGTGVVQVAPGHGEDDFQVTAAAGVPVTMTVDSAGRFTAVAAQFAGMHVFEANSPLLRELRERGVLFRLDSYEHPYPHCWRCGNPLIYRAVASWFVGVSEFRNRMVELNQQIRWVPEHVRDGSFGKWLENARDWSISRNRYWGSPIPVWVSDDPAYPRVDVYGSLDELERDFGVRPADLHRPFVDELTRPNPDDPTGRSTMRRVPEVLDCWFESGSMPFAQVHYPFENAEWFDNHYPGDFIVEYIGQTRGWFYTMHVLATALFDRPAFRTCLAHGVVLGDDGRKMSKSLRNYPDVSEVFARDGSDAMRWFLMSSPVVRGGNLLTTEQGIRDSVRQVLLPLWNTYHFLTLYAGAAATAGTRRADSPDVLDRYLLAKVADAVRGVREAMDGYDIPGACEVVRDTLDVLTNWYVRRSRDRFWAAGTQDRGPTAEGQAAIDSLHTALEVLCRIAAPLMPLTAEEVWRGLTGERSVHLTDWPDDDELPHDASLVAAMDTVRGAASAALGLRKAAGLRVRLPLRRLTVVLDDPGALAAFAGLLEDEVNVKQVGLLSVADAERDGIAVTRRLTVNARAAGPRLGRQVQEVIRAAKAGDWTTGPTGVVCGGARLEEGEYLVETLVQGAGEGTTVAPLPGGGFVVLDTTVDAALEAEGWARDVIRQVQDARREAGLHVSDRITLQLAVSADRVDAARRYADLVAAETLAASVVVADGGPGAEVTVTLDRA
jgi:isoleucyl-tRNA synthetase